MKSKTKRLLSAGAMLIAALMIAPTSFSTEAFAAEIKYVVNGTPVTTVDIQRRAAFLRLQQRSSSGAAEEMIEQALRLQEMKRLGINVSNAQVDEAYANFGKSNKLTVGQLDSIMAQSGVTKDHFREFIRSQMGWNQVLSARARAEGANEQDAIRRMLKEGGQKPTANEYILQQVIFVVPERERGALLAKRKREAQQVRERYGSCETSRDLVRGMIDVTVRELGRILEPELPPDWEKEIKAAHAGNRGARDAARRRVHRHMQQPRRFGRPGGAARLPKGTSQGGREPGGNSEQEVHARAPRKSANRQALSGAAAIPQPPAGFAPRSRLAYSLSV
jgi:peptidyl-prolyl cis-trans isomerase SurA